MKTDFEPAAHRLQDIYVNLANGQHVATRRYTIPQ
jgi:hypothetical protein